MYIDFSIDTFRVVSFMPVPQVCRPEKLFELGHIGEFRMPKVEEGLVTGGAVMGDAASHVSRESRVTPSRRTCSEGVPLERPEQVASGNPTGHSSCQLLQSGIASKLLR